MKNEEQIIDVIKEKAGNLLLQTYLGDYWARQILAGAGAGLAQDKKRLRQEYETSFQSAGEIHARGIAAAQNQLQGLEGSLGLSAAAWADPAWADFPLAEKSPILTRIGKLTFTGPYSSLETLAFLSVIGGRNLVIRAGGRAKEQAISGLQALVLRLLATVPPAKLQLLLIDPVGFGDNLAGFMNLADYKAELVNGKIWVESRDIEKQLADLSAHMEMVIQTYLRGRYESIEEYNLEAGEVAEPYRLVVVINFPANFSEESARRLQNIAANGPRCGVYTLVLVDPGLPAPHRFNVSDLEIDSEVISGSEDGWEWQNELLQRADLEFDHPPGPEQFRQLLKVVGQGAKEASKVEVPFARLIPPFREWWRGSARELLQAPIGRAGARKVQYFELGKGTAHHALVAGKTGMGKSNLFHALITSLSLIYSPAELELYLIDFKKGIEFKNYAAFQLPHARVIAIESEREFGLSVLKGLDQELERRGRLFRSVGCSSLSEYRSRLEESPGPQEPAPLPRILLIVDEFQEFFTSEDRIASGAKIYLDRLARQGRAFGIHIFLGSQSLSGTANINRGIMDQIGVRIAMQCSEADSRLVLSDDNPAARLLTRPGDGFYNAMNGLKEGNIRFQTAWLSDKERDGYLEKIRELARSRGFQYKEPVVFEGNLLPGLFGRRDHPLKKLLEDTSWPQGPAKGTAYIGEPLTIDSPVSVNFTRRQGKNLVILGRDENSARGIISSLLVSLALHLSPNEGQFSVADPAAQDHAGENFFEACRRAVPHSVKIVTPRDLENQVDELYELVNNRLQGAGAPKETLFFVALGLSRVRTIRREGGTGYKKPGLPLSPAEKLAFILREGPEAGIHVIAWFETLTSLTSVLDNKAMADFGLRIGLPISEAESRLLFDKLDAARLNPGRAVFYDDEKVGDLVKFRPYGPIDVLLLQEVGVSLKKRNLG